MWDLDPVFESKYYDHGTELNDNDLTAFLAAQPGLCIQSAIFTDLFLMIEVSINKTAMAIGLKVKRKRFRNNCHELSRRLGSQSHSDWSPKLILSY